LACGKEPKKLFKSIKLNTYLSVRYHWLWSKEWQHRK
jgi:hypothetical protein